MMIMVIWGMVDSVLENVILMPILHQLPWNRDKLFWPPAHHACLSCSSSPSPACLLCSSFSSPACLPVIIIVITCRSSASPACHGHHHHHVAACDDGNGDGHHRLPVPGWSWWLTSWTNLIKKQTIMTMMIMYGDWRGIIWWKPRQTVFLAGHLVWPGPKSP